MELDSLFSTQDIKVFQETFQKMIQAYFEAPNEQNIRNIIIINKLIQQCLSALPKQNKLNLKSMLFVLKIRIKTIESLRHSVQQTISSLQKENKISLHYSTLCQCLQRKDLFIISSLVIERLTQNNSGDSAWCFTMQENTGLLGLLCQVRTQDNVGFVLKAFQGVLRKTGSIIGEIEGLVDFGKDILQRYLLSKNDQRHIQQCLTVIKLCCQKFAIINKKETTLSLLLYKYPKQINRIKEILDMAYNRQYIRELTNLFADSYFIDCIFIWSNCSKACKQEEIRETGGKAWEFYLSNEKVQERVQYEIYAILKNIVQNCEFKLNLKLKLPKYEKNIHILLTLITCYIKNFPKCSLNQIITYKQINEIHNSSLLEQSKNLLLDIQKIFTNQNKNKIQNNSYQNYNQIQNQSKSKRFSQINILQTHQQSNQSANFFILQPQNQPNISNTLKQTQIQTLEDMPNQIQTIQINPSNHVEHKDPQPIDTSTILIQPISQLVQNTSTFQLLSTTSQISILAPSQQSGFNFSQKIMEGIKIWRKRAKKSKHRKYILRQWLQTQNTYLNKLIILRDKVRNPLLEKGYINVYESQNIFPNLDPMIQLSEEMLIRIQKLYSEWDPINTELAPSLGPLSNCLRLYKDYTFRYEENFAAMSEISRRNGYGLIVQVGSIQNYLMSPVQRFQKYHLLVRGYSQDLFKNHKDYNKVKIAHSQFLQITDEINESMETKKNQSILSELDRLFKKVVQRSRVFKKEIDANFLDFKCKVYILSDLIIIAKTQPRLVEFERIYLGESSFVRILPDCISFKNRLYICGNQTSIHLTFPKQFELNEIYTLINELINNIYQNWFKRADLIAQATHRRLRETQGNSTINNPYTSVGWKQQKYHDLKLEIEIIGVQKRKFKSQQKIYFIAKIQTPKPQEIHQIALCDFRKLIEIQHHLKELHPDLKIPSLEIKNKGTQNLTKMSEYICQSVEVFLNFILRNKKISEKPQLILHHLDFHESLWKLINSERVSLQCFCRICSKSQIFNNIDYYTKQKELLTNQDNKFCIINAFHTQNSIKVLTSKQNFGSYSVEEKLIWANCQLGRIDYRLQRNENFGDKLNFRVNVKLLSKQFDVPVTQATRYSTAREIIQQICSTLSIETTLDLAIVVVVNKKEILIDDDELVYNFLQEVELKQQQQADLTSRISNNQRFSALNIFARQSLEENSKKNNEIKICMRKIFIFDYQTQMNACQGNEKRKQLIVGEMLRKLQQNTFLLVPENLTILCSFIYHLENYDQIKGSNKVKFSSSEKLKLILPEFLWKLLTEDFMFNISNLIQNQKTMANSISSLYQAFFQQFFQKVQKYSWNCWYFPMKCSQQSMLLGNQTNYNIGISHKKITITKQQISSIVLEYSISVFKYRIYSDSLFVQSQEKVHRFTGSNLIVFDKMIKTLKLIYEFSN